MPKRANVIPRLLLKHDAAAYVGMGTTKFDELLKTNTIKPKIIADMPRFDRDELDELIDGLPYKETIHRSENEWDDIDGSET